MLKEKKMKTMRLKEAMSYVLTLTHPIYGDRKVSKHYVSKKCHVQPIMIDRWLNGDTKTIRPEAAKGFKEEFDIMIDDADIGGQTIMRIENNSLVV